MIETISDQIYITEGKLGKTGDIFHTFSYSRYNAGGLHKLPSAVYFAIPSLPFPVDRIEEIYYTHFYKYLLPVRGNFRKRLEYIDPRYTEITVDHIQHVIEDYIRQEGIRVRRLKKDFIKTIPFTPSLSADVRNDYEHYTEPV